MPNPNNPGPPAPPSRKIIWIIGGVLILFAAAVALQGVIRGTGEAVGIREAAPGDANVVASDSGSAAPGAGDNQGH